MKALMMAELWMSPASLGAVLARISPFIALEVQIGVGVCLTVLGTLLQWQLPRRRMSLEEHMKDGKITEVQVVRRLKFYHAFAPFLTICGAVILIAAFLIYAE
jgi:hypothetical protein